MSGTAVAPAVESRHVLPDLDYVKGIPILDVAQKLNIHVPAVRGATWTVAHCFRPQNHKHGDSTPSLNFQVKKNKYMCFACDTRLHSNVDLVMAVEGYSDIKRALAWFDQHYDAIPRIKAKPQPGFEYRAGVDEFRTPEDLVRAGLVPHLTDAALRVFTVLAAFRDKCEMAEISFETIKLRSGISSNHTIGRAVKHLEGLSLLNVTRRWRRSRAGGRQISQYEFTFDDPKLFAMLAGRDLARTTG